MAEVSHRQADVLRQAAVDLATNNAGVVVAQVLASDVAPSAVAARKVEVDVDPVAGLETVHTFAKFHHVAGDLVADYAGQLAG